MGCLMGRMVLGNYKSLNLDFANQNKNNPGSREPGFFLGALMNNFLLGGLIVIIRSFFWE